MKQVLMALLLIGFGVMIFQSCEGDPVSSEIGPLYIIEVNPTSANIQIDSTLQFIAIGKDVNENVVPNLIFNWESENASVASINESGLLTGISADSTTITASVDNIVSIPVPITVEPITVTDIDGNLYSTIKIGNQIWMAENLNVIHYRNGDLIATGYTNSEWSNLTTGAYAVYDDTESNANIYGYLYNWYAVDDSRNIAPVGWHVPTDDEWQTLIDYLGGNGIAGGKLKEAGTMHWNSPNTAATNEFGFTALPGGYRHGINGSYNFSMGDEGNFWSSTDYNGSAAWQRLLLYVESYVHQYHTYKDSGFSIRCVKD